jgi:hypothetical protein
MAMQLVPRVNVGDVELDDRALECLESVVDE